MVERSIRRAQLKDVESLAAHNQAMAAETENRTLPQAIILAGTRALLEDDEKGFYLVAEQAGQIVGQLMVTYEWSDWRNGQFWWIQSVYVRPETRRQGILRALFAQVEADAKERGGICGLRLYSERNNLGAHRAYENLGLSRTCYEMFEREF